MNSIVTSPWKENKSLEDDLRRYVLQNMKRKEILDFIRRDYPSYCWSMPTLARRLSHFGIKYINYDTTVEVVKEGVLEELAGPGKLLGYKTLNQKLRTELKFASHGILFTKSKNSWIPKGWRRGRLSIGKRKRR